jgi:hypothetical protein
VQLVQVDAVGAQPPQGALDRRAQVPRRGVGAGELAGGLVERVAPLGGDHHVVAVAGEGAAEDALAVTRAVHVGGVEERHAQLQRPPQRPDRLLVVDLAPPQGLGALPEGPADRPAPDAERAHLDAATSKKSFHGTNGASSSAL